MERFEEIMECLGIDLKKQGKMYVGPCPIHGGDKFNAINIYHTGDDYVGNWKCRTQQCEKHFVGSIIGFIRGVLSHNKYGWTCPEDKTVTFNETLQFISACLDENYDSIDVDFKELERNKFIKHWTTTYKPHIKTNITRSIIRQSLQIPSKYFINRGFNLDILDKYDVGLCINPREFTYNRIVVPIYDEKHRYIIGNTSRSIFEKCQICESWHNPKDKCPQENEIFNYSKWKHSSDFRKEYNLYNYWFAKEHILKTKVAILTESPGNIWKLEECGIPVGLGTYGASFCCGQKQLLNQAGAMTIIVIGDNDKAGQQYNTDIISSCQQLYKIITYVPKTDIGDMTPEEIYQNITPLYLKCINEWKDYS